MQYRRVKIVYMNWFLGCADPIFVGRTMNESLLDTRTCQPRCKGPVMMFSPRRIRCVVERRPAKFGCPNDQDIVQHPLLFQVLKQTGNRLIHLRCQPAVIRHIAMRIPIAT